MGYTHYWYRGLGSQDQPHIKASYGALSLDIKRICETAATMGIKLGNAHGEIGSKPKFTESITSLNGIGDESHESFVWPAKEEQVNYRKDEPSVFTFCKTAHKPYDAVVTASLIRAKHYYGDEVDISSDGNWSDWQTGRDLYQMVFNEPATNPMSAD